MAEATERSHSNGYPAMSLQLPRAATRRRHVPAVLALGAALSACLGGRDDGPPPSSSSSAGDDGRGASVVEGRIVEALDGAIWHVHQARNGDHWFASQDRGVYCYDGERLVRFTTADGLCDDRIGLDGIQEDGAGNLYFSTLAGVSRFDGTSFKTLEVAADRSAAGGWRLDPDDLWFAGAQDSGAVYRYDGEHLHRLELPRTEAGDEHYRQVPRAENPAARYSPYDVYRIFEDRAGRIWFGTSSLGVCRYDGRSFAWIPDSELRNGSFGARSIVEDQEGRFWFCSGVHRYAVDPTEPEGPWFQRLEGMRLAGGSSRADFGGVMSSILARDGALWMATYEGGVWRYDGEVATHFPVEDAGRPVHLFSVHEDGEGVLWLGTQEAGVHRFDGEAFARFRP